MSQISLRNVYKSFGTVGVIDNISLDIREGELMVFVGPSGCGKSTLLRLIAGLDQPTKGDICIGGEVVNQVPAADRGLAMVFQSYALYPHMTVTQNLSFGLENAKLPRSQINQRINEAARLLDIAELMDRRPGQLSGGQRQRVAIGRAIVRSPTAFLLDEPLSNLDAKLRVVMRAELSALHARLKKTMVYVTHDQVEAMTLADRIVVLRDGCIEQVGTPLQLYNTPQNQFVAGFIGAPGMNFLSAGVESVDGELLSLKLSSGESLKVRAGKIATAPGEQITLGVRPHDIQLSSTGKKGLEVEATLVEAIGSETIVHTRMASDMRLLCVLIGQQDVRVGSKVRLAFNEQNLHFFDSSGIRLAPGKA